MAVSHGQALLLNQAFFAQEELLMFNERLYLPAPVR
jgi:hypothetical protein